MITVKENAKLQTPQELEEIHAAFKRLIFPAKGMHIPTLLKLTQEHFGKPEEAKEE